MKFNATNIVILVLAIFLVYLIANNKSGFMSPMKSHFQLEGAPIEEMASDKKSGVPAGLIPNEVPVSEDFAQFNTDYILSNQNYLDPRNQIGYPETVGGTLRNANLQIRSEPTNPRDPVSIFNLSTIVPEQMRPAFEIGSNN
jgi:hypothetical protein